MPEIRLVGGPGAPRVFQLGTEDREWLVGSARHCQVVLRDEGILEKHLRIRRQGIGYTVEPAGETSRLSINGREAEGLQLLEDEDEIQIGGTLLRWRGEADEGAEELSLEESLSGFEIPKPKSMFSSGPIFTEELTQDAGAGPKLDLEKLVTGDHLMDALGTLGEALRKGLAVPDIALASLARAFSAERALLFLPLRQELELVAHFVGPAELDWDDGLDNDFLAWAISQPGPVECDLVSEGPAGREKRSLLACKVERKNDFGVLLLDSTASVRTFDASDHRALTAFAHHVALLFEMAATTRRFEEEGRLRAALRRRAQASILFRPQSPLRTQLVGAAQTQGPVLLMGETGTGKASAAKALHSFSDRSQEPFVLLDCSKVEDLAAEIFGVSTLARNEHRPGILELAGAGTAVLAECTALDREVQGRLLEMLCQGRFQTSGDVCQRDFRGRLVLTSSMDPGRAGGTAWFHEELLDHFPRARRVRIPPLREDPERLRFFTEVGLEVHGRRYRREPLTLCDEAWELLLEHPLPENLPQLHQFLDRVVLATQGSQIEAEALARILRS